LNSNAISVFEQTNIPIERGSGPNKLSEAEADNLSLIEEQLPGFCLRGYKTVRFQNFCGLVNLGERVLEILPKVGESTEAVQSRNVLLRLLQVCPDFPLRQQPQAGQAQGSAPLLDIFIQAFFEEVAFLIKGGLLRRYLEQSEDLLMVRGSVRLERQLTALANRSDRIACRYDELTADNDWNRLLKAGLREVRPWIHGIDLQRRWIELMDCFDGVTDLPNAGQLLSGLIYDRQGNRYRTAIEWVARILSLLSPSLRAGQHLAPGLLFDMNRLFEAVVTERMKSWAWERKFEVEPQYSKRFLANIVTAPKRSAFKLRPDLLFSSKGRPVAIADAKWKRVKLSSSGFLLPDQADLYQLNAYGMVFACDNLALVFPWNENFNTARETVFELPSTPGRKPRVTVVCMDLAKDDLPLRISSDYWQ
jgi:5-methylcytosine-specific restriction enzyme subunit McrC